MALVANLSAQDIKALDDRRPAKTKHGNRNREAGVATMPQYVDDRPVADVVTITKEDRQPSRPQVAAAGPDSTESIAEATVVLPTRIVTPLPAIVTETPDPTHWSTLLGLDGSEPTKAQRFSLLQLASDADRHDVLRLAASDEDPDVRKMARLLAA